MQRDICVFILNSVLSSPEQSWSHQGRFAFWTWGRFAWGLRTSSGTSHTDHWTHQPDERSLTRHEWLHNLYYGISDEAKQFQGNWSLEDCNFTKFTWLPLVHSAGLIWPAKSSQHLKIIIWQNGCGDLKSLLKQKRRFSRTMHSKKGDSIKQTQTSWALYELLLVDTHGRWPQLQQDCPPEQIHGTYILPPWPARRSHVQLVWIYFMQLTDWRDPIAVLSTRILQVNVMKSWAVPRWKKLMLDRSNPLWK